MKRVLVTGAAGSIGTQVIKYLLSEGKYEITALDLRNKTSQKKLRKYRRRINIIYGDINDSVLMEALIKDQDFIIHLAGVMPPLADIKNNLSYLVEYKGTENMIKAINYYNPDCFLVYTSSTTIYGPVKEANINSKTEILEIDYYTEVKLKVEKLIKEKLKNYTILRIPLVLGDPKSFMYNVRLNTYLEAISDNDAAYMLVKSLSAYELLNKKIFNVGGGDACKALFRDILANILDIYGLSFRYLFTLFFIDKNFYSHVYKDSNKLNEILEYRSDSLASYYMRLKRNVKKRFLARILAKPFVWILRSKKK